MNSPITSGGSNTESIGGASVFTLVQMSLHIPSPTEGLSTWRASVCPAVDVSMVLKGARMLENLAALVTCISAHAVWCNWESFGHWVWKKFVKSINILFLTHLIRNPSHDSKSESRTGSVNKTEWHSMLTTELITIVHEVAMYIFTLSNLVHVCISYRWRSG